MASNAKKAGAVAKAEPTDSRASAGRSWRRISLKSPTHRPIAARAAARPCATQCYVSPGWRRPCWRVAAHTPTRPSLFLGIALAAALFAPPTAAIEFVGKVVGVTDGDTIAVLVERRAIKVRLAEIDAAEKGQPYGSPAKQALSDIVFGKVATVREQPRDRYGRTVGRVYVDGRDVNAELVRTGHAWVYQKYATDRSLYRLEAEAKAAQRGLWALPEAQRAPPWE
jgi:endonuclease YncB( thermonuclease family)